MGMFSEQAWDQDGRLRLSDHFMRHKNGEELPHAPKAGLNRGHLVARAIELRQLLQDSVSEPDQPPEPQS